MKIPSKCYELTIEKYEHMYIYISYGIGTSYNSWVDFISIYFVGIDKDYNVKPLLVVIVGGINK